MTAGVADGHRDRRVRVVHLCAYGPPYPVRAHQREATTLAEAGYQVAIVGPGAGTDTDAAGVRLIGVPVPGGRLGRMTVGTLQLLRRALAERPAILHLHAPQFLPAGLLLRLFGRTVVFDAHEDLPRDITYKHYIPRPLKAPLGAAVALLYRLAGQTMSAVFAPTEQVAGRFGPGRAVILQNFPRLAEFPDLETVPLAAPSKPPTFVYVGDLTEARGVEEMLAAARLVAGDGFRLRLGGRISTPKVARLLEDGARPGNVDWLGWIDRQQLPAVLGSATAGLCVIGNYRSYREAQPVKVYEYMAMGLPVIASNFPEWRARFGETGCAIFVDPEDPAVIAAAMQRLAADSDTAGRMGRCGQEAVYARFNWALEEVKILDLYSKLINK